MWSLRHLTTNNVCYRLLCGGDFMVGRKNASILITNDASISREHAVLSVAPLPDEHVSDVSFVPLLRVKDLGSKYGTSVNSKELAKSEETALKEGDTVTFGRLGSTYKICYDAPFVVTTSCLAPSEKESLKTTLKKIGARLKSDWSECCTHVVMSSIRLTTKTTAALLAAKPVVTPAFFTEVYKRAERQNPTDVDPANYIPDVTEECLTLSKEAFGCKEARKTVFAGKTFYFLTEKQYKSLGELVSSGGARTKLIRPDVVTFDLLAEGSCVIKPLDGRETPVCRFLIKNKLRSLSASDVGMAVIHCSTEKFCNPRSRMVNVLWGNDLLSTQSQVPSQAEICVPDTDLSQQGMAPRHCNVSDAPSVSTVVPESRLSSLATSGLGNNLELTLGANTGTTVGGLTRTLLSPSKASPFKNPQLVGEPSSPKQPFSPKRSPRKIRKKDAINTLSLECYFGRQSQKRKDDTEGETSAAKARRLNPLCEPEVVEIQVKEEVLMPPSPEPVQWEENTNGADEAHHMEATFAGTSQRVSQPTQRSPYQPQNIDEPNAKPSPNPAEALVNRGHDPSYFTSKRSVASAEGSLNGDYHMADLTETSMVVVELADLVLRNPQPAASARASALTSSVPNFKRFRKAHQAHLVGLPRIIGGPDLEVYVPSRPGEECDDMEPDSQDISHVFNYRENNKKRRRVL